ncbi:hypothetical protein BDV23DRAFT_182953 [Aspergillus alliaceus]|uniref:Uncharacterized protein n=1 Tax=Petromyces alliaceus TaxID=209559 RepID=A0A5N7CA74_PETAA|nr:hypothetical protein BDV23DRAFT_182953 [Aspergillus alliaceus]
MHSPCLPLSLAEAILSKYNLCTAACARLTDTKTFALKPEPGSVTAQFTSCHNGLDGHKVEPVNESTYDWWYFVAINIDSISSCCRFLRGPSLVPNPQRSRKLVLRVGVQLFS